ncbi:hypothetical protein [Dyella japonica]|uniref:Secreted protein n=1 Tax=Dyella japonica DSM 16301 TaxID=1440762 RepID=A0A0G9H7T9_9GAMM|nr:hypothetical protein [Dyella japonica]KLD63757.1 hypothetical protein Y882_10190 [Dyella japonica DSM 16301]
MPRTLMLALMLSLSANTNADCDLRYAPPDVRAAALAFHHHTSERRQAHTGHTARAAIQRVPREEHAERPAVAAIDHTLSH